nr:MAG TPA: hypothetical protein [Caudoviricetes sp.]
MLILTDDIFRKTLMLAELQCDSEIQDWLASVLDPAEVDLTRGIDAVKARDNSELTYYGLSIRQITDLRPRYIPDVDSLAIDLGATAITVSEESSLADIVSALYYVDPERGEKYL